jgi:hypothetical protein
MVISEVSYGTRCPWAILLVSWNSKKTGFLRVCTDSTLHYLEYRKPKILQGYLPLPLFQEMSKYENHIETRLGTENGLFKVCPDSGYLYKVLRIYGPEYFRVSPGQSLVFSEA